MISDALLQDKTPKKLTAFVSRCVNVAYEIVDPDHERLWMTTLQELIAATASATESPTDEHKAAVMELRRP